MTKSRKLIPVVIFTLVLMYGASSPANAQGTELPFFSWVKSILGIQTVNIVGQGVKNTFNTGATPLIKPFAGSSPSSELRSAAGRKIDEIKPRVVNRFKVLTSVVIGTGKIVGITGASLTATDNSNGKTYTILTGKFDKCTTKFVRKFGGKSDLSEYTAGDTINVAGYFTDDTKTTVQACLIRDLSIQKRHADFMGMVKSLTLNGFVMTTLSEKRADQTVSVADTTKLTDRKGQTISKADILVGHKINVRGLWNTINNTVTQTTDVRDLSLPTVATSKGIPAPVKE